MLYYGTGGENWKLKADWLGKGIDHCDSWYGITCDNNTNGLVTAIDLSNNNLKGSLPPPAFQFQSLTELDLSDNILSDGVPAFEQLISLKILELYENPLQSVPDFILPTLTYLDLDFTFLTEVPDFNLPSLATLYLSGNNLSEVPNFDNLPLLKELYLISTNLIKVPSFDKLTDLTTLNVSNNPTTSIPQALCDRVRTISKDAGVKCEA